MVMNNEVKEYLANHYFAGQIPGNLVRYLYDRYGEEPLEGCMSPQLFWSYIADDVNAYINGELDITLRTPLQKLQDRYDELSDITGSFADDIRILEEENAYLRDFIHYIHNVELYEKFRKEAHIEEDEMGFDFYTL